MFSSRPGVAFISSVAAPPGTNADSEVPWVMPWVMASKPPPAAPSWKQPASFMSTTVCRVSCQPSSSAKVTSPSARCWFQSGVSAYTRVAEIAMVIRPGLGGTEPAMAKKDLPVVGQRPARVEQVVGVRGDLDTGVGGGADVPEHAHGDQVGRLGVGLAVDLEQALVALGDRARSEASPSGSR